MLTHVDEKGNARMVDVTDKADTRREAVAAGRISMSAETLAAVADGSVPKGDVLAVARVAGIMAAKKTPELIPLCHPLMLTKVEVELYPDAEKSCIECVCTAVLTGKTGVEMEALTGVSTALLTVYDMCKAMDKSMVISDIRLMKKSGGKSGEYIRNDDRSS